MNLQESLEAIRKSHDLPALGMITVLSGKPTPPLVTGVRQYGRKNPAQSQDAFHLGSDTKAMTATLIGLLIDQGKLTGKTTLGELFADLFPKVHTDWKGITVEQLLAHRAGLEKLEPKGKNLLYLHRFTGPLDKQRERWLTERLTLAPDETLGKFAYSNAGYTILGMMAERIVKQPWESLIQEHLWKSLGITGGGFGPPPQLWQHLREGSKVVSLAPEEKADNPPLMAPAGAVHLPLADWARYVALYTDEAGGGVLKPETLHWLTSPLLGGNYNGGWNITSRAWAGGAALTHAGSNTMNYCVAWVAPKKRFAALVATNIAGEAAEKACDEVIGLQIRHYLTPSSSA